MDDTRRIRKVAGCSAAILLVLHLAEAVDAQDVVSFQQMVQAVSYEQGLPIVSYDQELPMALHQDFLPAASQQVLPTVTLQQAASPAPYRQQLPAVSLQADDPLTAFPPQSQTVSYQQDIPAPGTSPTNPTNPTNQEKMGQAPENTAEQFLREDTILLKQGQWQFDASFSYTIDEKPFTQITLAQPGNVVTPVSGELHRRLMVSDFAVRYGVTDRLQFFADLPVGWTNTEVATLGTDSYLNDGGLGDTSCGVSYLFHKGCGEGCDPDIILTAGMTAPTSHGDFLQDLLVTPQATLGQGFWAAYWNVLFVQNYDPVVVFYGFGSRHTFTRELDGFDVQAGDQYSYRFGVGFSVNERVTLSSTLAGAYITEPRINGQIVPGTSLEPVYLRCALTLAQRCDRICEPFVECGLTDDSVNTRFGITWTF